MLAYAFLTPLFIPRAMRNSCLAPTGCQAILRIPTALGELWANNLSPEDVSGAGLTLHGAVLITDHIISPTDAVPRVESAVVKSYQVLGTAVFTPLANTGFPDLDTVEDIIAIH